VEINQLIQNDLPFLDLSNEIVLQKIATAKWSAFYSLQNYLKKLDTEVEDESTYKPKEKILVAAYTAYQLLITKTIETVAGDAQTGVSANNKILTKAKADVVETEFTPIKATDGTNISLTGEKLVESLKDKLCDAALNLEIVLPMCNCGVFTPLPAFKIVK
jgi:hypothetical protein